MAFNLLMVFGYSFFSNSIPQMRSEPPTDEIISLEGMTLESFAALGNRIYEGKGTCPLCHNPTGQRAPLLVEASDDGPPVASRAENTLKDERYKGEASSVEEYLRESMVDPSAFVVAGFGKTGTNDTVSPMPDVSSGSVNLSDLEIDAVIAYLQQSAGVPVTVALPTGDVAVPEEEAEEAGPVTNIDELVSKYECTLCHIIPGVDMGGEEPDMGPDLSDLNKYAGKVPDGISMEEYIKISILEPNKHIAEGFEADMMPEDFADRLRVSELEMIIDHLMKSGTGAK